MCNQAGWHYGVQQRGEGVTKKLVRGRDVTGNKGIVGCGPEEENLLWSPLGKQIIFQEGDVLCIGCKAEISAVLWS